MGEPTYEYRVVRLFPDGVVGSNPAHSLEHAQQRLTTLRTDRNDPDVGWIERRVIGEWSALMTEETVEYDEKCSAEDRGGAGVCVRLAGHDGWHVTAGDWAFVFPTPSPIPETPTAAARGEYEHLMVRRASDDLYSHEKPTDQEIDAAFQRLEQAIRADERARAEAAERQLGEALALLTPAAPPLLAWTPERRNDWFDRRDALVRALSDTRPDAATNDQKEN